MCSQQRIWLLSIRCARCFRATSLFLGSDGSKFFTELSQQYQRTDLSIEDLAAYIESISTDSRDGNFHAAPITFFDQNMANAFVDDVKRMRELIHSAEIIGEGALGHRVVVSTRDEFARLASAFNLMAENRELAEREITEARENLENIFSPSLIADAPA